MIIIINNASTKAAIHVALCIDAYLAFPDIVLTSAAFHVSWIWLVDPRASPWEQLWDPGNSQFKVGPKMSNYNMKYQNAFAAQQRYVCCIEESAYLTLCDILETSEAYKVCFSR